MLFASTNLLGGSGFLAVYLYWRVHRQLAYRAIEHVFNVMDGLAWLAQASMFLVLGLLVTPSRLLDHGIDAIVIAVFLTLVARDCSLEQSQVLPLHQTRNCLHQLGGLTRCGADYAKAIMPLTMDVPQSELLFEVAFAVVILSLMIQGSTISVVARLLKVVCCRAAWNQPEKFGYRMHWRYRCNRLKLAKIPMLKTATPM